MRIEQAERPRASAMPGQQFHHAPRAQVVLDNESVGLEQAAAGARQRDRTQDVLGAAVGAGVASSSSRPSSVNTQGMLRPLLGSANWMQL